MSNLSARLLTAAVVIPLLIAAIEWSNPIGVWLLVFSASLIGMREWIKITMPEARSLEHLVGVGLGAAIGAAVYWLGEIPHATTAVIAAATVIVFLYHLFAYRAIEAVATRLAFTIAGWFYVVVLLSFLALAKRRPEGDGAAWVYIMLTVAWLSDTGAYFAGRFLGPRFPRKLYESVSPKKTMVGGVGGVIASVLAVVLAKVWYLPTLGWADCFLIGIPANVLGQCGDLCESLIKRAVGVKDSGALLPGHGGMLDRIDALLFVCPYVFYYAHWCFKG